MRNLAVRAALASGMVLVFVSVLAGVSAGSAGQPLIIGRSNNAGTSNTSLTAKTSGNSFVLYQDGSGSALRGWAKGTGNGVSAQANSAATGNGVLAVNSGAPAGKSQFGTAVLGNGGNTWGVVGTSSAGTQHGDGVQGEDYSDVSQGVGTSGFSGTGVGTLGATYDATGNGWGVLAATTNDSAASWGLVAQGCPAASGSSCANNQAARLDGNTEIDGNLAITGTCTGCTIASVAVNGTNATIRRGDAVALLGARAPLNGDTPLLVVAPATAGSRVIGIAAGEILAQKVAVRTEKVVSAGPFHRLVEGSTWRSVLRPGAMSAPPGRLVLVVTQGVVGFGSADAAAGSIHAGDSVAAGSTPGRLEVAKPIRIQGRSFTASGSSVGYALGNLSRGLGTIAVLVSPH